MEPVTVTMPLELTGDMLRAVRSDPLTQVEDKEQEHARIGWLICVWDVLVQTRPRFDEGVVIPMEALQWLMGELGEFEPADARMPQPEGYKRPQFWWRSEFKKRAGLE